MKCQNCFEKKKGARRRGTYWRVLDPPPPPSSRPWRAARGHLHNHQRKRGSFRASNRTTTRKGEGGGGGGGVTVGWEGVAHPLLVDDVDEDAQAEQLLLLHSAHLLLLPPLLSSISCPRPVVEEETVSVAAEFFGSFE